MRILFLTLVDMRTIYTHGIYADLLRELVNEGNDLYVISPVEKKKNIETHIITENGCQILKLKIGNTQKTNIIEKGISTLLIEPQFKNAIEKYYSNIKFDLVLYSTPPITFVSAIEYVKKRDCAKTYLLLKDIFPQNAIDIGMMSKTGLKGVIYSHFRRQEKRLYSVSDWIGCMSKANVEFVLKNNTEIDPSKVEICPNSVEVVDKSIDDLTRIKIREKYNIPIDKRIIVYGGNLGKPQDIPYLVKCIDKCQDIENMFFLVVGDGVDYKVIENYVKHNKPQNLKLMKRLPKDDYDLMISSCDIGLIVLDHRFTIPNFPSRLLGYMQARLPVLALTDTNTDVGKTIIEGGFGWWCESKDPEQAANIIKKISRLSSDECKEHGENGYHYLCDHYQAKQAAKIILNSVKSV